MCGENTGMRGSTPCGSGTSPHVWGKRERLPAHRHAPRNIPTCVGKTIHAVQICPVVPEHPHMCGENSTAELEAQIANGTSPHVWGKREAARMETGLRRNIPTCVGKTIGLVSVRADLTEHPHMCGENASSCHGMSSAAGTSPHVWGKRLRVRREEDGVRNIPTCVGKTQCAARRSRLSAEHPHMCGENPSAPYLISTSVGTSPHVWGKLMVAHFKFESVRNIPTCVGKTR